METLMSPDRPQPAGIVSVWPLALTDTSTPDCCCCLLWVGGQMAERLGSRASNPKVAGSIPGCEK